MDRDNCEKNVTLGAATAEEIEMAQRIFEALERLAPDAFITGNPSAGRMRIAFDGEFNLLDLVRLISSPQAKRARSSGS